MSKVIFVINGAYKYYKYIKTHVLRCTTIGFKQKYTTLSPRLERHKKHSPRRSWESDQPPARKRIVGHFWSQNLTVDLRRIYFDTPGFDSMIATISWRQMHKAIIFLFESCPSITNKSWTDMHAESTQTPTCWQLAGETRACGVGGQWHILANARGERL